MNYGAWLGWQIDYLLLLQSFRDASCHVFDKFFLFITMFGEVAIPIIVISTVYWALNKKVGQFILWSYLFGFIVNQLAKVTACIYRPWILDCRVKPLADAIPAATGYSFPSGHTAGVMSVWGGLALSFWNNKIVRYLSIAIILCVMFSRNYLGVHTPQDVIVSFLLSCVVLYGTYNLVNWEEKKEKRDIKIVGAVLLVTVLMILYINFKSYPIHYLFGKILYDPTPIKIESLLRSGFVFGAFIGWLLEKRFIGFNPEEGTALRKIMRVVFGLVILAGMFKIAHVCTCVSLAFVQHFLMGIFLTCLYPFMVKVLKI